MNYLPALGFSIITLSYSLHAMEETSQLFLSLESQKKWVAGIRQMVEWSQGLPNRKNNKIVAVYEECYNKILLHAHVTNILEHYPNEVALAKQLLENIRNENKSISALKVALAQHKILFPSEVSKKDPQWQEKSNKSFLVLNEKTSATTAVIAGSLIAYKLEELKAKPTIK